MLEAFFNPRSIAVIGASREQGKIGHTILRNIIGSGFKGKIFPINPNCRSLLGLECYPKVLDVREEIDLGVIAVPASIVPSVVEDSGKSGMKALIVISAGLGRLGEKALNLRDRS